MSELREEKRHKIRQGEGEQTKGVAEAINMKTSQFEKRLISKWAVPLITILLSLVVWFTNDFVANLRKQIDAAPSEARLYTDTVLNAHKAEVAVQFEDLKDLKREQKRMSRNLDRMSVFFETRFGMPHDSRAPTESNKDN